MRLTRMFSTVEATAHCDLPCGVYDPAQARIEAESVKAIQEKYQGNEDPVFRQRAVLIKEQRSELVKHHLWVLWTDYFKPPHFEKYPQLHELFNKATKQAGAAGGETDDHGEGHHQREGDGNHLGVGQPTTPAVQFAKAHRPGGPASTSMCSKWNIMSRPSPSTPR